MDSEVEFALKAVDTVLEGKTADECQRVYDAWCKDYDKDLTTLGANLHLYAVECFTKYSGNIKVDSVLDVGSGTGTIGAALRESANYVGNIDIMDANMEMLYVASKKNLNFRNIIRHTVEEDGKLVVRDDSYDVMFCIGSFVANHIPATSVKGMLKAVRSGGLLIFSTRCKNEDSYKVKFDQHLAQLEKNGYIERLGIHEYVHFTNTEDKGAVSHKSKPDAMGSEVESALKAVETVLEGKTADECQRVYDAWCKDYDKDLTALGANLPLYAVECFTKYSGNLKVNSVLDVGSGTCTIGAALRESANYQGHIDIMDANMEMLYVASKKNLNFRNIIRHTVNEDGKLVVRDDSYDVMFCIGSFVPNHIPATSVKGMLKAVRSGGLLIFSKRGKSDDSYKVEFDQHLAQLEKNGCIERLGIHEYVHFSNTEDKFNSFILVYRRL